ncbi:MAG: hypothetical protein ACPGU5_07130 [Lishizhenia sp.]
MKIDSEKVIVKANSETIFEFVKNPRNFEALLPQDNITDFQADDTQCSFKVQGGIVITLVQQELEPFSKIVMKSGEKSPFPFHLNINMKELDNQTEGFIQFEGKVNAFLKMMVQKPLTNLFNYMSTQLKEKYD